MDTGYPKTVIAIVEQYASFFAVLSALFIIQFDVITGEDIEFPILFVIPVTLTAWGLKIPLAYGLSIALPMTRVCLVLFFWEQRLSLPVLVINAVITVSALTAYTYLIVKISEQNRILKAKLKLLESKIE